MLRGFFVGFPVLFFHSFTEYQLTRLRDHCPGQTGFVAHYNNLQCLFFPILFFQVKQFFTFMSLLWTTPHAIYLGHLCKDWISEKPQYCVSGLQQNYYLQ